MTPLDVAALADEVRGGDVVVIGSGVAGASASLALPGRHVTLLSKAELARDGSSHLAQGGVAAAIAEDDSPAEHAADTLAAGAGLCAAEAVRILTTEGPRRVRELIALGARFDRGERGQLLLGREGAHGRRRIVHARGDATGSEMMRALRLAILRRPTIEVRPHTFALDLVLRGDRVVGVLAVERDGRHILYRASAVVLACGGLGQLFARTTNPAAVTGDGLAMAARAGARLADLEMVQFHPTALRLDPGRRPSATPLITEALRGEGAILVDERGERFMVDLHPLAELAPRDIVARAIWDLEARGRKVFLDPRQAVGERFEERFPTVFAACRRHGIDPRREPIPVSPAAHYTMGGVATDGAGRTSLPGLWACGEVAATGVHGANRLASNSLLEGLVFGARVAEDIARSGRPRPAGNELPERVWRDLPGLPDPEVRADLQRLMWRNVALVRSEPGLEEALQTIDGWVVDAVASGPATGSLFERLETANLLTLARLVTAAALAREESRGAHFRRDFPRSSARWSERLFWTYAPDRPFPLVASGALDEVCAEIAS